MTYLLDYGIYGMKYRKILMGYTWRFPTMVQWWYPNGWMVYFMENPNLTWMI
jgi:hypothetical protein